MKTNKLLTGLVAALAVGSLVGCGEKAHFDASKLEYEDIELSDVMEFENDDAIRNFASPIFDNFEDCTSLEIGFYSAVDKDYAIYEDEVEDEDEIIKQNVYCGAKRYDNDVFEAKLEANMETMVDKFKLTGTFTSAAENNIVYNHNKINQKGYNEMLELPEYLVDEQEEFWFDNFDIFEVEVGFFDSSSTTYGYNENNQFVALRERYDENERTETDEQGNAITYVTVDYRMRLAIFEEFGDSYRPIVVEEVEGYMTNLDYATHTVKSELYDVYKYAIHTEVGYKSNGNYSAAKKETLISDACEFYSNPLLVESYINFQYHNNESSWHVLGTSDNGMGEIRLYSGASTTLNGGYIVIKMNYTYMTVSREEGVSYVTPEVTEFSSGTRQVIENALPEGASLETYTDGSTTYPAVHFPTKAEDYTVSFDFDITLRLNAQGQLVASNFTLTIN